MNLSRFETKNTTIHHIGHTESAAYGVQVYAAILYKAFIFCLTTENQGRDFIYYLTSINSSRFRLRAILAKN